jgi:hypothetical protein
MLGHVQHSFYATKIIKWEGGDRIKIQWEYERESCQKLSSFDYTNINSHIKYNDYLYDMTQNMIKQI